MNWFVWRQHRKTFLIFGILLVAFAAVAIPSGIHFWHVYQQTLASCAQNPASPTCSDVQGSIFAGQGAIVDTVFVAGLFTPLLLGLFLGSPLLAKEYEEGTNKLAWTQSVSRRKWLSVKLAWALAFALVFGLAITLLTTWWSRTSNAVNQNRFDTGNFDVQGIVPIAYSVFFTAVGFATGAWFRKTIVALAITLGVFVLCMASFGEWVRPHYMTPVPVTSAMGPDIIDSKIPSGAWILARDIVDKNGKTIAGDIFPAVPPQCQQIIQQAQVSSNGHSIRVKAVPTPGGGDPIDDCLNKAGFHQIAKYQPSYRYWDFQRIEAGIYLGMTALVVGATYWLVLRRDA